MAGLRLQAELGGDGSGFEKMMLRAGVGVDRFASKQVAGLKNVIAGAFSLGAIENLTRGTIEWASKLRDVSDTLGVNVEWLQEMQFVAKQNGGTIDDLNRLLLKLTENRAAALGSGGGKQLAAFQKFGIGPEEIQSGKLTNIVDKIAEAFRTGSQQELEPAFRAIGGKGAAILIPSFVSGIMQGREQARESGQILAEDMIDSLDDIDDAFQRLSIALKVTLAPAIIALVDLFKDMWGALNVILAGIVAFLGAAPIGKIIEALHNPNVPEVKNAADIAQAAMFDAAEDWQAAKDAEAAAAKVKRNSRANKNANITIGPLEPEKAKFQFAKNSDSLSTVGNFLGGSGAAADLVSVGEKTNQILSGHTPILQTIATNTGKPADYSGVPKS